MNTIRWGIVGAGRIAHTFARDISSTSNGVLHAVAARDGRAARAFADQYDAPKACAGYDALYADPDVDAIYVATPHTLHLQNSSDALRAGKAVLCEKPLTTSAADCERLIDIAEDTGGYLMEAMWTWFLPAVQKAKQWVDAGRIGNVVQIQATFGYPMQYSADCREYSVDLAGGCLLDMGIYPVAFATLFADAEPLEITAVSRHAPNGVEDDVVATLRYENTVATIGTSFRARLPNWGYVIGDRGYVALPSFWCASECQLMVADEMVELFADGRSTHGFNYQIESVNNDLLAGRKQSEVVPLSASLAFQRQMDRIRSQFPGPAGRSS
ncbi:MAG: Gfo/Idh/MocA family oxidoreductase [Gammaproteobacteria bacterium]|nr:Gfo/Idh/MocA family oxidoreductase [Gammaproteobacteria bacterium]